MRDDDDAAIGRDRIRAVLGRMGLAGLHGWVVCSVDGRVLVGDLDRDLGSAAAVVASSHALAERTGELLGDGAVQEALVRTADGVVASYAVGTGAVLTLAVDHRSNLGQVGHAGRRAASEVEAAVGLLVAPAPRRLGVRRRAS